MKHDGTPPAAEDKVFQAIKLVHFVSCGFTLLRPYCYP